MTDRELLELAAKAAGISIPKKLNNWVTYDDMHGFQWWNLDGTRTEKVFNPLQDDGDALRLAVKLGLAIRALEKCVYVESDPETLLGQSTVSELEMYKGDPYAATRLAIVRAAAEIGKGME